MGAGHYHALEERPRASERVTTILALIVGVVVFATAMGAAAVWPTDFSYRGSLEINAEGTRWVNMTITEVGGDTFDDPTLATVDGEEDRGSQALAPVGDPTVQFEVGDRIRALEFSDGLYGFSDFERDSPLIILAIAYVVLVIAVAWWRGLGSLVGLALAFGIVVFFTIPALFDGGHPLIVGLVTGAGALFALLYLAHGPNARTTTAYLGTLAGLAVTAVLAWWAVGASHLQGFWSEEGVHLEFFNRGVPMPGLILCGIVLAGLGVLNDVTVTQASAVWELRAARPDLGWWSLFARGMRIGRDHIASTVYTIAFAYVGAALPTLMFVTLYNASLGTTLTSGEIAEEIVRTLVGSIGLVLAVPLTTLIGALVVAGDHTVVPDEPAAGEVTPGSEQGSGTGATPEGT